MATSSSSLKLDGMENQIMQFLSEVGTRGSSAKDLARRFQMEKSCMNHILYNLKSKHLIDCSYERPPIWSALGRDKIIRSLPKRKLSRERSDDVNSYPTRTSVSSLCEALSPSSAKIVRQECTAQATTPPRPSTPLETPRPNIASGRFRPQFGRGIRSPPARQGPVSRGRGLKGPVRGSAPASTASRPLPPHEILKRQNPEMDAAAVSPAQRQRVEASTASSNQPPAPQLSAHRGNVGAECRRRHEEPMVSTTPPARFPARASMAQQRAIGPRFRPLLPQRLATPQAPRPPRPTAAVVPSNEWQFPAPVNIPIQRAIRPSIVDVAFRPLRHSFTSPPRIQPKTEAEEAARPKSAPSVGDNDRARADSDTEDATAMDQDQCLAEVRTMEALTEILEKQVRSLSMEALLAELPAQSERPPPPAQLLGVAQTPAMLPGRRNMEALMPDDHLGGETSSGPSGDTRHEDVSALSSEAFKALSKNPVSVLNEFAQTRGVACSFEIISQGGPPHRIRLEMCAKVGERFFPSVSASSKKDGRREAADRALRVLLAEGLLNNLLPSSKHSRTSNAAKPPVDSEGDRVAHLAHTKFAELAAQAGESLSGRKVLAAIVERRAASQTVVAMGTGNRCVTGLNLSMDGLAVNDCHAEVVARRGFMRYLYRQLSNVLAGREEGILEAAGARKWRIKDGVTFHLYISTAPCGDGALFVSSAGRDASADKSPDSPSGEHQPTFAGAVHGLLRTKIEGGEGTIPVEPGVNPVQTMDGIARGERLRTMSCSDKVCRWNLLGIQGALLSNFLHPVYLSSLTIGLLFDRGHLSRGVCCRLDHGPTPNLGEGTEAARRLPSGFRVNHPRLGRVTQCEPQRELDKTSERSLNWCAGDAKAEVLDGTTGRCVEKIQGYPCISRLAKRSLFSLFQELSAAANRPELTNLCSETYAEAKKHSEEYQTAKKLFQARFKAAKLGVWVKKPSDQELFTL